MRFIGITGGVGAGKSAVLEYLAKKDGVRIMLADGIAHTLMECGTDCYGQIIRAFPNEDILNEDGSFDRKKLADVIFFDGEKRARLNGIVHPAVREYVVAEAEREREAGRLSFLFLEAALLIEEHYDEICDELWYIYADGDTRRARLMETRGYSAEKVARIFSSQLKEEAYRAHCAVVIDNGGELAQTYRQIEAALGREKCLPFP